jgi:hypothetical protein
MTLREKLTVLLAELPSCKERSEDWNPYEASGGNFDDAYDLGITAGEAGIADQLRAILEEDDIP